MIVPTNNERKKSILEKVRSISNSSKKSSDSDPEVIEVEIETGFLRKKNAVGHFVLHIIMALNSIVNGV